MKIQVSCFATLSKYTPEDGQVELEEGATPDLVLDRLLIPREEVKIVFINGQHAGMNAVLKHGDRLGIFPAIGGG